MSDICSRCGLPADLCVCESIARETQKIGITTIKKKFGKVNTRVEGIDSKDINIRDLAKKLKNEFACGGTVKKDIIELQGDHKQKIKEILITMGFSPDTIVIK